MVAGFACPAYAAEVIHRYDSHITVKPDGRLLIAETIEVTAEGQEIIRGIYRDFPLFRRTFLGGLLPSNVAILSVTKNGENEAYHTEDQENILRLYIGRSHVNLPIGERYEYKITYETPPQIFFYDQYDELNWNIIGTGWNFPIERASVEIILPGRAPVSRYSVYTGKTLSKSGNYNARQSPGRLFVETHALAPHEGMTVAVALAKGYVNEAANMSGLAFFWRQHLGLKTALFFLLLMASWYAWAWHQVGRDPKGRSLIPFYTPPSGISPAMAAHILAMGSSNSERTLTAAILSLAAKGYLVIEEKGLSHYKLALTGRTTENGPPLSEDENTIYKKIGPSLTIRPGSTALVGIASDHRRKIEELCHGTYFRRNSWWWFGGLLPLVICLLVLSFNPAIPAAFLWIGVFLMLTFGGGALWGLCQGLKQIATGSWGSKAAGVFLVVWAVIFSMGGFMGLAMMGVMISWLVIAVTVVMIALFVGMRALMKAPTRRGRAVMDEVAGLQYYMEAVEEKILKKFDPPQMSRELYEKYLPYAVALGVDSKWGQKFALAAAGATAAAASSYTAPSWYAGSSHSFSPGSGFSPFSVINNFSSTVSAASTVASSGSSGGGSVGGGGGGGGGGGW